MTQEQFAARVAQLEAQARRNPNWYRYKVLALALAGYGYLAGILLMLLALFIGALASAVVIKAVALKLAIPIGAFTWLVLKAMWVRLAPPQGLPLKPADAPELFALIDKLRHDLKAPRFHRVLITDDFNAGVSQVPLLGPFGWHRNYLILGLPLMKSLSRDQFTAVLAHEFGHLSGGHGRLSNWLYRLRMSWARLQEALEQNRSWGTFVFKPFFTRFIPYFNAYSFPLARSNEFEADAVSARLTSPRATAQALTNINVAAAWLDERYWPGIHALAEHQPRPAFGPYDRLGHDFSQAIIEEDSQRWLTQSLERRTDVADTHPSLSDRLTAIGQPPEFAPPAPADAADSLLGPSRERLTRELDEQWQAVVTPHWERRHQHASTGRQRLAELKAVPFEERSFDQAYEYALLMEDIGAGPDEALLELRAIQLRWPDSAGAAYALGRRLLARDDEAGVALLEFALSQDRDAQAAVAEILRDYWWRKGETERAHAWHAQLEAAQQQEQLIRQERDSLHLSDKLEPHGLSTEQLEALCSQLRTLPGLRKAYCVRKKLKHKPEHPLYVLGFCVTPWWMWHREKHALAMQQQILDRVTFPGESLVISLEGDNYRFHRKLRFRRGTRLRL